MKPKTPKPKKKESPIIETINTKHDFSDSEKLDLGSSLTEAMQEANELADQLKTIQADYRSRIQSSKAKIAELSNKLRTGYDMRPTRCRVVFNGKTGRKRYFLADSKKAVLVVDLPMTPSDYNRELPLEIPPAPKKEEKVVPVVTPDGDLSNPVLTPQQAEEAKFTKRQTAKAAEDQGTPF